MHSRRLCADVVRRQSDVLSSLAATRVHKLVKQRPRLPCEEPTEDYYLSRLVVRDLPQLAKTLGKEIATSEKPPICLPS